MIRSAPRTATVVCAEDAEFLVIDREAYIENGLDVLQEEQLATRFKFFRHVQLDLIKLNYIHIIKLYSSASGDQRETDFLLQRLAMCACIATIASHSDAHFRMIVKPGKRPDFLEKCLAPDMIFFFLAVHLYFWLKNIL